MEVLFLIFFLLILWNVFYKQYLLDSYRSRLFDIRNKAFRLGIDDKGFYKNEGYLFFEQILNNSIRYAHDVSVLKSLFVKFFLYVQYRGKFRVNDKSLDILLEKIDTIKDNQRKVRLTSLFEEYKKEFGKYIVLSSFCLMTYLSFYVLFYLSYKGMQFASINIINLLSESKTYSHIVESIRFNINNNEHPDYNQITPIRP